MKLVRRIEQTAKIEQILAKFKDLKQISGIKNHKHKEMIPAMRTANGNTETGRQSIADVFADFYAELYATRKTTDNHINKSSSNDNDNDNGNDNNNNGQLTRSQILRGLSGQ